MSFGGGRDTYTLEYLIKVTNQGGASGFSQLNTGLSQTNKNIQNVGISQEKLQMINEKVAASNNKVIQGTQGVTKAMKGMAFGILGLATSGAEFVGMMSMWKQTTTAVSEAQREVDRALKESGKNSKDYKDAINELAKANRWARMTFRNLMLSMFDMVPFFILTINGIVKLRTAYKTLREAQAEQAAIQTVLQRANIATSQSTLLQNSSYLQLSKTQRIAKAEQALMISQSQLMTATNGQLATSNLAISTSAGTAAKSTGTFRTALIGLGTAAKGVLATMLKIAAPIAAVIIAVKAWKENWGGVGDVINDVGVAIGNIHPVLKTAMEWIAKIGEAIDRLIHLDFAGAKNALFGGGGEDAVGPISGLSEAEEKALEEHKKRMQEFAESSLETLDEVAQASKSDRRDLFKNLGIKGKDNKKDMREYLDNVENFYDELNSSFDKFKMINAMEVFEGFGDAFKIPSNALKKMRSTLGSDLEDAISGKNDPFQKLGEVIKKNAGKSTKEYNAAILQVLQGPQGSQILSMLRKSGLSEYADYFQVIIDEEKNAITEWNKTHGPGNQQVMNKLLGYDAVAKQKEINAQKEGKTVGTGIAKGVVSGLIEGFKGIDINAAIGAFNNSVTIPLINNIQTNIKKIGGFIIDQLSGAVKAEMDRRTQEGKMNAPDIIGDFITSVVKSPRTTPIGAAQTPELEAAIKPHIEYIWSMLTNKDNWIRWFKEKAGNLPFGIGDIIGLILNSSSSSPESQADEEAGIGQGFNLGILVQQKLGAIFDDVITKVKEVWAKFVSVVMGWKDTLGAFLKDPIAWLITGLSSIAGDTKTTTETEASKATANDSYVKLGFKTFLDSVTEAYSYAENFVKSGMGNIVSFLNDPWGWFENLTKGLKTPEGSLLDKAYKGEFTIPTQLAEDDLTDTERFFLNMKREWEKDQTPYPTDDEFGRGKETTMLPQDKLDIPSRFNLLDPRGTTPRGGMAHGTHQGPQMGRLFGVTLEDIPKYGDQIMGVMNQTWTKIQDAFKFTGGTVGQAARAGETGIFGFMTTDAATASIGVQTVFSTMFTALTGIFTAISESWTTSITSMAELVNSSVPTMATVFAALSTTMNTVSTAINEVWNTTMVSMAELSFTAVQEIGNVMILLAQVWSEQGAGMLETSKSVANETYKLFNQAIENVAGKMNELASHWSKVCNSMIANAKSAAKGIQKAMDGIKDTESTHTIYVRKVFTFAEGGLMSFAQGGMVSAAGGLKFTTNGPTMAMIGDNPGGRESIWAIPHNNPAPTVANIERTYKGSSGESPGIVMLNGNFNFVIPGNDIVNDVKLNRRIRTVMGSNMDRFG